MALPTASNLPPPLPDVLPRLPKSWSALTWRELCGCWWCKMRYGGNADVAQAAALLELLKSPSCTGREWTVERGGTDPVTGETVYLLSSSDITHQTSHIYKVTPRELSQIAKQALPWFQYPYGDPGKPAVKDDSGKVIEEAVDPVRGYVNPDWTGDAMALPEETVVMDGDRLLTGTEWQALVDKPRDVLHFRLPAVALHNLTWQQYRSLQTLAPMLFQEGVGEDTVLELQAQFLAHMLVPARNGTSSSRFDPKRVFTYDADRAEQAAAFWRDRLMAENVALKRDSLQEPAVTHYRFSVLFHILFQVYQTALSYYALMFPLLFNGSGKGNKMQDALTGEVSTINAVMKYQNYTKPEDVYAENLPVILSTLNTMTEEAKQIEQMNAKIKHKR